jgi:RHS repeat-associated protein
MKFLRHASQFFLVLFAFMVLTAPAKAQLADGDGGWKTTGSTAAYPTAEAACKAQWQIFNNQPKSRFIGAIPTSDPNKQTCSWTRYQYLCRAETGGGISACGTVIPSYVVRVCSTDYVSIIGKQCAKADQNVPERDCSTNNDSQANPAVGNPFILSTGCKILRADDYATADGQLEIGRAYRSLPIGASVSAKVEPLGLAGNWTFDFAHEIQLGAFSGSPASPTAKMALVASDGTAYDFVMQSGGAIVPDATTGAQYVPKNIKIEAVGALPTTLSNVTAASSQWKMTDEDETVWTFQTFPRRGFSGYLMGRPISRTTKENYRWDFTYATDGALQSITDSFGRTLNFSWNYFTINVAGTDNYPEAIKSVSLPDGTSLRYTYDPAPAATPPSKSQIVRLVKVEHLSPTAAVLRATSYAYEDARHIRHITSIKRTDGSTIATYSYDGRGRGVTTALAGNVNSYTVASAESATEAVRSVVGPLGKVDDYRFTRLSGTKPQYRITQINELATSTTPASAQSIAYGSGNFITSAVDEEGRTTNFTRDARGNPLSTVEAAGTPAQRTTGMTMHPTLNLPAQIVETGLTTSFIYDAQGKMLSRTETDTTTHSVPYSTNGQTRSWTYNWATTGRLLSINGPKAAVAGQDDIQSFTYGPTGNLLTTTNALGHVTSFAGHDGNGRPATMTDPNGVVTAFTYDLLGRTTAINVKHPSVAAQDAITAIEYDSQDRVIGITTPSTDKLLMDYNVAGQLTAIRAASGERIDYVNDAMGNVTSQTVKRVDGSTASAIARSFDALGRMLSETLGANRTTTYQYDRVGNMTRMVSARGNGFDSAFDPLNRLVSTVAPDTGASATSYDAQDNQTSFKDAINVSTSFVRNGFGEVIQEVSPDRGTSIYSYDAAGDVVSMSDGRGQTITYARDMLGRVLSKTPVGRPAAEVVSYAYDAVGAGYRIGRLASITDGSGTTSFSYDHRGNLIQRQQVLGSGTAVLAYAYDLADRIIEISYPSGRIVAYDRDSKGRVLGVRSKASVAAPGWTSLAANIAYEPFAALKSATLGASGATRLLVDRGNDGRLASRRLERVADGAALSLLSYAYDNDDNIIQISDGVVPANDVAYGYDSVGRLAQVTLAGAGGAGTGQRSTYAHDKNGNRLSVETRIAANDPLPASSDVYSTTSGTNRLASITSPAGIRSISYDARGNPTSEARPAGQSVALAYDGYGRLLSYARSGEVSLTHSYNGMDDRISTTTTLPGGSAHTRHFIYAPDGRVLGEYGTSATDVKAEFIWLSPEVGDTSAFGGDDGLGGYMPLAVAANDNANVVQLYWVHANHMGVPALYTDASGAAIPPPTGYSAPGFPGQSRTLADLYYNRYRDYDPTTGRYIQADPIGLAGGASPYSYAMNNPLRYTDPTGEIVPLVILGGMAAGAGIELAFQAGSNWWNGRDVFNYKCYDWWDVGISGLVGGVAPGISQIYKSSRLAYRSQKQLRRYLRKTHNSKRQKYLERRIRRERDEFLQDYIYPYATYQVVEKGWQSKGNSNRCECR